MLTVVTGSERKRREIAKYLGDRVEYVFMAADLPEIQGNAAEVMDRKLRDAHAIVKGPVVVEDYSLYLDCLCGFPGPYVKSLVQNNRLAQVVKNLQPLGPLTCRAECLYGYIDDQNREFIFSTSARGVLVAPPGPTSERDGIDGCFIQEGTAKLYNCLDEAEETRVSIRRQTIEKLVAHLTANQADCLKKQAGQNFSGHGAAGEDAR